jgi:phosphocarrier protein
LEYVLEQTMAETTITVAHEVGLHARPASLFVQKSKQFTSDIRVKFGETVANAKSIMSILTLGVCQGGMITISAQGEDEEEALASLVALVESNFGESK